MLLQHKRLDQNGQAFLEKLCDSLEPEKGVFEFFCTLKQKWLRQDSFYATINKKEVFSMLAQNSLETAGEVPAK